MKLRTESYLEQVKRWPKSGKHILTQCDADMVIVYQAYRPAIGQFAAEHQYFGGEFSFNRMSWIKTNFLWMMYRSGWGTKDGQEVTLAVRLAREGFDEILRRAVHSSYVPEVYGTEENWKSCLRESNVRLQWDPDHDPFGTKQERRAIQLGLSGEVLRQYAKDWILSIEDISEFVAQQRTLVERKAISELATPVEGKYLVGDSGAAKRIQIDSN